MDILNMTKQFQSIFQTDNSPRVFFAPGRINLIGEHTDYNGGHVFPAAISFGTYAVASQRSDQKLRFYSMNFPKSGIITCDLANLSYKPKHDWANYPKGIIKYILEAGFNITSGMDILFYGNIPNSSGLSSSASIEMVTGVLLEKLFDITIERLDLVKIGQKVENNYIRVNSGIMDQFTIGMGKKDHAILLNCDTLDYHYAPIELEDHVIMIIHTNKERTLAGSKYNERREQCENALHDLQTKLDITSLGQLTTKSFEQHKYLIKDETDQKRAKHAVYENARTLEALEKLRDGNLYEFGRLMNASHVSLRDDYEVTGLELDIIVGAAWEQTGVIGARMTGAGFGGCAVAIIEKDRMNDIKQNINTIYHQSVGYDATFYTAAIGDGAKEITIEGVH